NLCDILMIVLIGYLTGCKDIEEIHFSAEVSEEMLRKYLELPNGIPSTDTILRVLAGIDGKELEKALAAYTRETFGSLIPEKEIIAIDGKTIRRSEYKNHNDESKSHKAAHVVSAFASSMGICFGQVKTEEKSNEITAIPELLELLELKGLIVTIDAMGCQKKIAEKIT
ncbi:MAG: ISAs1 family transposase, partial [Treponema sp.]|nr:ISAs1 family transposase [Treponema sp.]